MKKRHTLSITTQLTFTLISMVSITLVVTGSLLISFSVQSQMSQLQIAQQAHAQVASEKINSYVDDLQRKLTYLARVRGLATFDTTTQADLLEALINQNKAYEWVALTDAQGRLLQSASPFGVQPEQEWATTIAFRRSVQAQEDFVGQVELYNQQSVPTLILAVPIRNQQNNVSGMLVARINLKFLWAVLEETQVSSTGDVYVIDRRLYVIAQSRDLPQQFAFEDLSQRPLSQALAHSSTTKAQIYRGLHNEDVLGSSANVAITNWQVIVEIPLTEAYAPIYDLLKVMGLGLLFGIIVAMILGLARARQIIQPLRQLTSAATHLRFGDLETRVVIDQNNEFNILADAFNHMAGQLGTIITQLRNSEENLAITLQSIADAVIATDAMGHITRMNSAAERMTNWSLDDALGRPLSDVFQIVNSYTRMPAVNPVQIVIEQGNIVGLANHTVLIARNGQEYQIADSAAPIRNADGQIVGVVLVFSDVTERYQAETALRESEALNSAVLDSLAEHIAVLDQQGIIMAVNRRWRQFAENNGASELAETSIGINYLAICAEADHYAFGEEAPAALIGIRAVLAGEQNEFSLEYPCPTQDEHSWFRLNVTPLRGTRRGAVISHENITERKRAEEEKAKLEAQLYQAQKMESVGRLAGGVAHDFNNILGVILGHAELALYEMDPALPIRADLVEIQKAAQRSANLTRQLLAFARKQTVAPKVLNLNETVEGMFKMLERMIGENINLIWAPAPNLWSIKIDPTQIDQILANLCVNARDAITNVGKITIETANRVFDTFDVAYQSDDVAGSYVMLSVSDTGYGIDQITQQHIFEPFFTTKAIGQGTGLGLATVYGIVKQNNGFIKVTSELGHGTTFQIFLPQYMDKDAFVLDENTATYVPGGSSTILLVEDEPALLNLASSMLTRLGYHVLASSPHLALQCANTYIGKIDLLITDVIMPEINGWDLATQLLALYPRLKCLFMSGYTAEIIAHHGVLNQGVSFIQKPFSLMELATKIREVEDEGVQHHITSF